MNPFSRTLNEIDRGNLTHDLDEKLAELVDKVKERGKAGAITLSIKIKPLDADADSVSLVASVKVTEPAKAERASIFFTTDDNQLVRDNPKQAELPLQSVPKASATLHPVSRTA